MTLTLKEIRKETEEANSFIWTSDAPFSYIAGQHLSLMLPLEKPDIRGTVRTFTLSSSPTEEGFVTITTKRGPSSFKQALFSLPIGSTVEARAVRGSMVLDETAERPHVMLAGGIGITPFRSMIKYAFDKHLSLLITLLYSNKTPEEIVFRKELDTIASTTPNIKVVYTITQPNPSVIPAHEPESIKTKDWIPGQARDDDKTYWREGRIDEAMIKQYCPDLPNTIFCTAGPTGLVEAMIELLKGIGVLDDHVKFEKFSGY